MPVVWLIGVLVVGLVLNAFRIDEGPTMIVVDTSRGWGLHQMDVAMIAIAVTPVEVVGLIAVIRSLARGGRSKN